MSPLSGLTNLTELSLSFNNITDVSALTTLPNLTELDLTGNLLSDASFDDHIPTLEGSGATVEFRRLRTGDFDIELVFLDPLKASAKKVLQYAARRWMSVVAADVADYVFTDGWSGRCGDRSYEIPSGERIDDLRVYVTSYDDKDRPLGQGGPTLLRDETHLPVLGCMEFDRARANLLIIGLHEMGHVLGIGPVWWNLGFYKDPGGDPHFDGPLAIAAFDEAGGSYYMGAKVPLNDSSHWKGAVFGSGELMLPWGGGALSAITVQSLADLGYGVDVAQADAYRLRGAVGEAAPKLAAAAPAVPGFGVDVGSVEVGTRYGFRPGEQARVEEAVSSDTADERWYEHARSAGRMGNFGFDSGQGIYGVAGRTDLPDGAESRSWCGAGHRDEPIYVVDEQGRIMRTIGQR